MSYYRSMSSFLAYLSTGSIGLTLIFILMIWINPSKSRFYALAILATIIDGTVAYLLFFTMIELLIQTKLSIDSYQINWTLQALIIFIMLPCICLRISIGWLLMDRIDSWKTASSFIRTCYVIQILLSGMIGFLIFVHCFILSLWFIWKYLLFLGNLSLWLLRYLLTKDTSKILSKNVMNNTTITPTNFTSIL